MLEIKFEKKMDILFDPFKLFNNNNYLLWEFRDNTNGVLFF